MADPNIPQILYDVSGYLVTLVIAWAAVEIRLLRKEVSVRVHKEDCRDDMGEHCKRLENVEKQCIENGKAIASINAVIK